MYREFMKKMIKAKKLEYEAIKELLPDSMKEKVSEFEKEALESIKDFAMDIVTEEMKEKKSNGEKKVVKKIGIDFN